MRQVSQLRPSGDPSAAPYAPQRDIANLFLPMLRETFCSLDEKSWNSFFREVFQHYNVTESDLGDAVAKFIEAHRLFIRDREVDSVAEAFDKAGITAMHDPVKYALFCRLGEVITGGFFVAIRDVTMQGCDSPCATEMAKMIAAGRALAERLGGSKLPTYEPGEFFILAAYIEEKSRTIKQLQQLLDQNEKLLHDEQSSNSVVRRKLDSVLQQTGLSRIVNCIRFCWKLWRGKDV